MFDNVIFPLCAVKDVSKSETFPVDIQTDGFNEYRSTPFDWEYYMWKIPSWSIVQEDKDALVSFLRQRKQGLRSFKFIDPDLPRLVNAPMKNLGVNTWLLAVPFDATTPGTHPIFHPSDTIQVRRNGFIVPHSFAIVNGLPTLTVAGTSNADTLTVSGDIYFAARLDSPFGWTITALNSTNTPAAVRHSEIQLKEVFEY